MNKDPIIFSDICKGSSSLYVDGHIAFIKHPDAFMEGEAFSDYEKFYKSALDRGVMSNDQAEELIKKNGDWRKEDEDEVVYLRAQIEENTNIKKSIRMPSQALAIDRKIKDFTKRLMEKDMEKRQLMGLTAELVANTKANDSLILNSFYSDGLCQKKLFSVSDYEDMKRKKIETLLGLYNDSMKYFSDSLIQTFVLSDFFSPYFHICDSPTSFFGKAGVHLTKVQLSILFYTKVFKNIFDNVPDIPDRIRKEPESLLQFSSDYREQQENLSKNKPSASNDHSGRVMFGATKDDLSKIARNDEEVLSLNEAISKRSGGQNEMNLKDFLKLGV